MGFRSVLVKLAKTNFMCIIKTCLLSKTASQCPRQTAGGGGGGAHSDAISKCLVVGYSVSRSIALEAYNCSANSVNGSQFDHIVGKIHTHGFLTISAPFPCTFSEFRL